MNTICQSCGMPLDFMELRGTEKDGRKSDDYCMYCYKDGHFTYECTMQQMIDLCLIWQTERKALLTKLRRNISKLCCLLSNGGTNRLKSDTIGYNFISCLVR